MFEKLQFPFIHEKDLDITKDPRWQELNKERQRLINDKEGFRKVGKQLEDLAKQRETEVNPAYQNYNALWQGIVEKIDNDPMMIGYKKAHPGKTTAECFDLIAKYYKEHGAENLAKQIKNMKDVYTWAPIVLNKRTMANSMFNSKTGAISVHEPLTEFVYALNKTNARDMDENMYYSYRKPEKSLLDEAYEYLEGGNFADVQKDPEALMSTRLGWIAKEIETQLVAIENASKLYNEVKLDDMSLQKNQQYDQYIQKFDIQKGYNRYFELEAIREQNQAVVDQMDALKKQMHDGAYQDLYKKYENEVDLIIDKNAQTDIEIAVNNAKAAAQDKAEKLGTSLWNDRNAKQEAYKRALEKYESDLLLDKGTQEDLDEALERQAPLQKEYDDMLKAAQDKNRELETQRRAEHRQQIEDYNRIEKEIQAKETALTNMVIDVREMDSKLLDMDLDWDTIAQFRENQKEVKAVNDIYALIKDRTHENTSKEDREKAFNLAVSDEALKTDRLMQPGLSDKDKALLVNAMAIRVALVELKANDENLYNYIQGAKSAAKKGDVIGTLNKYYMDAADKVNKFIQDNKQYVRAEDFFEKMEKKYGKVKPDNNSIKKLSDEVNALKEQLVKPLGVNEFEAKLKADMDANLKVVSDFKKEQLDPVSREVEMYRNSFRNPVKPDNSHILSDDAIEAKIKEEYAKNFVEADVRNKAKQDFINNKNNFNECVTEHVQSIINSNQESYDVVKEFKATKDIIENIYAFDKEQTLKKETKLAELNQKLSEYNARKANDYKAIGDTASEMLGAMDKGRKAGHKDTPEFEAMKQSVDDFTKLFDNEKQPSAEEIKAGLQNIKDKSHEYYVLKQKGVHLISSNMRYVRLSMCDKLQKFADDMIASIDKTEEVSKSMSASIDAYIKSVDGRQVLKNENSFDHFTRCCCEAQGKKIDKEKGIVVDDKKPENKVLENKQSEKNIELHI